MSLLTPLGRRLHAVQLQVENGDPIMKTDLSGRYLLVSWLTFGTVQIVDTATGKLRTLRVGQANEPLDVGW